MIPALETFSKAKTFRFVFFPGGPAYERKTVTSYIDGKFAICVVDMFPMSIEEYSYSFKSAEEYDLSVIQNKFINFITERGWFIYKMERRYRSDAEAEKQIYTYDVYIITMPVEFYESLAF